jgi:pimeloyl-ACP methyl ester carboxylesterase
MYVSKLASSEPCGGRMVYSAATLVALLTVGALFVSSSSAGSSAQQKTGGALPTIVLVHGAWADSGSWNSVVRRLQHDGYTVDVPPNPLRGLANDSGVIESFLQNITGPIVLVGHSYGGAVITNAARGSSQVRALVYVDAFIPDQGETLTSLTAAGSCFAVADINTVLNFVPFPGAPAGVFDSYVKPDVFPGCFANGLPARKAAILAATQRPLATNAFSDPSGVPAWKTIPSWAVIGTEDHTITPASQRAMAQRANAHITQIAAPHLSMIAKPVDVTQVIERAASATN